MSAARPGVNVGRPLALLGVAAAIALGSLAVPDGGETVSGVAVAAASSAPPVTAAAGPCSTVRQSLRPQGALPAAGAMPPGSTMAKIAARGRLVVGVDQGKYLLGYRNPIDGQLEGTDIDIVHRIAAAIFGDPDRVQFVVLNIADRVDAVASRRVDMVVNSFAVTCERQQRVEFSTQYMTVAARLLVPVDAKVSEVEDLAGRRICTSTGSTTVPALRAAGVSPEHIETLAGIPDCMVELQHGRVGAVASDDVILAGLAAQDPQTRVVGRSLLSTGYAVGMSLQTPDLVRFVNGVLESARADGSLAASNQRWLGGHVSPVPQPAAALYRD